MQVTETIKAAKSVEIDPEHYEETMVCLRELNDGVDLPLQVITTDMEKVELLEGVVVSSVNSIILIDVSFPVCSLKDYDGEDVKLSVTKLDEKIYSIFVNSVPLILISNSQLENAEISRPECYKYCIIGGVENLNGLDLLKNLEVLIIVECNSLQNVEGLKNLTNITQLILSSCESLQNVDGLKNLTNITQLILSSCESLQNVDGLINLTKLTELDLSSCKSLQNVDGLINLTKLTELDLSSCKSLQNVDGLINLTKLTELDLSSCESLQNVDGLNELTNITELNLSSCKSLPNVDGLKELTNITELNLRSCDYLQNVNGLANLTNLTELNLSSCKSLQNVDGLKELTKLTKLNLFNCESLQNVDGLKELTKLTKLNLSFCSSLQNVDGLKELTKLTELDLSMCSLIKDIGFITDFYSIEYLNIDDCISLTKKSISSLTQCKYLKGLSYRNNPLLAESILMFTALLRKDVEYIIGKKETWLENIQKTPELEPMATRLVKTFSLVTIEDKEWGAEAFKDLFQIFLNKDDCSTDTIQTALDESLICGYPAYTNFFELILQSEKSNKYIQPLLSVLCELPEESREWALTFAEKCLGTIKDDKILEREIGTTVCLFYATINLDQKVKEWLTKITDPEAPIWRDKVSSALCKHYLKNNDLNKAKLYLAEIETQVEKDKTLGFFAEYMAETFPLEAGGAFEAISDTVSKFILAEKLQNIPKFTEVLANVYALFLTLQSDQEKLAKLVELLLEQHPESTFVQEIIKQFSPFTTETTPSIDHNEIASEFFESDLMSEYFSGKQIRIFKEKIAQKNNF